MDEAKYNKEIGRIKCIVFKTVEKAFGFIEGNSNTNGKDFYFKLFKDDDYYLDRGDLVSFRPREYNDGSYSAFNVTLLDKDTAFWKTLYSENGQNLYEKIKLNLRTKDLNKIWKRIPVDQMLNHEWLLKDIEGPEAVSLVNTLIKRNPENYKELILELIAQNKEAFQALVTSKVYPIIIAYIINSIPDDYLLEHEWLLNILTSVESASFLDSLISEDQEKHKKLILKLIEQKRILFHTLIIKSKFPKTIDYILNNEEVLEIIGTSLPVFIANNGLAGSGAIDLESIPRHLITEEVLSCFNYKKRILFLIEHDDLRNRYHEYFTNIIRNSSRFDNNLIFSLPEKFITRELFQLFKSKDQINFLLKHEEKLKEYNEYFEGLARDYKEDLGVDISIPLAALKCFNLSQQKTYLLRKYKETNGLKEYPVLLDYLRYLLVDSTDFFSLNEIPEDLLTDDVVHKLPLYDRLSFYGDRIIKYFDNTALKNGYLKKWEKAALEEIDIIEAGTVNPLFVTESVFNAFNRNQKTEYVMKTLLKVGEQDKTIDPEVLLDRLSQCGDFKLEEIGNLPKRFLNDRRLLDALKKSHNEPAEKVRFIYQLVNSSKLSMKLVDSLQPEEGTVYAPVHYLVRYFCTKDRKDFEHMHHSFYTLKKHVYQALNETGCDAVAAELSVILPVCYRRESLDYGSKYRYLCDAVLSPNNDTKSKANASKSWCRGFRCYFNNYNNTFGCPNNIYNKSWFGYERWTMVELFHKLEITPVLVEGITYPEDYLPKICGAFNSLFKLRHLLNCRFCGKLMKFEGKYSKENPYRDNGNIFAVYVNTVASCTEVQDKYSEHDYYVYLSHCHVCGEDSVIDSRESHFQDKYGNVKFYLCMQCGSGGLIKRSESNYYYVTKPGTVCPKCGSDNMKYIGRTKLEGVYHHVFQCNEKDCRHKIGLRDWNFNRFYPAGALYDGENLRGKGFIREGYELYKDNVLVKVYDSNLKRLVNVLT